MSNIVIKNILVGELYTNCYLCKNKTTGEGFIVDPGDDALKISAHISSMEMKPVAILLTHGHYDHVGAVDELKSRYGIKVLVAEKEKPLLSDRRMNLSKYFGYSMTTDADEFLTDGQMLTVAGIEMKFILTPGHTPGSGCFYLKDEGVLFSGDTMFHASRGRTDFPGGSDVEIIRSIREKLLVLPSETEVFPGHESSTTIGDERIYY